MADFSPKEWAAWEKLYQVDSVAKLASALFTAAKNLVPSKLVGLVLRPTEYELPCHISDPRYRAVCDEYINELHKVDIWLQRSPVGPQIKAVRHSDYTPLGILKESPFYKRFLAPLGTCHGASITAWKDGVWLAVLTLLRSEEEGDFTENEMDCLLRWQPHFARAVFRIVDRHELLLANQALESFIRALPTSIMVLSWRLQLLHHNVAAVDLCKAWQFGPQAPILKNPASFRVPGDILEAIQALKPQILAARTNLPASPSLVPLSTYPHPQSSPLEASIQFVPAKSLAISKGTFLVNIRHVQDRQAPAYDRLRLLSRRERECASHAGTGKSSSQIADILGISGKTVRHHLSASYAKLGISQRHELIALMAKMPSGVIPVSYFASL